MVRANDIGFCPVKGYFICKPVKNTHACRAQKPPGAPQLIHVFITDLLARKEVKQREHQKVEKSHAEYIQVRMGFLQYQFHGIKNIKNPYFRPIMETVVSGIRSTGKLHLGNYYGAIQNFVKMQHEYNCFFFIADLHSLTTHPTPADLHGNVKHVLVEYLAAGLDPEKATIYVQSDVPEVAELYLYLNMNAYVGELERSTSFKDKIRAQSDNVNAGLLTYPVLMAADIIIHKPKYR